jgi:NADH:ubiquinone oxidoreductase subunit 6 (subunit J)
VDHDQTESELTVARRRRAAWDIQELLGIGLIVAIALLATAYVAAGIMEAGASPGPNQIEATLLYATEWVSPYLVLFPLAALALAAWSVHRNSSHPGRAIDAGSATDLALAHLARARVLITITGVALVVIVGAAIGALVSSILLFTQGELGGNPVWASEAETLGVVSAALLLAVIGLVWTFRLWGRASELPAGDEEEEWESEPALEAAATTVTE